MLSAFHRTGIAVLRRLFVRLVRFVSVHRLRVQRRLGGEEAAFRRGGLRVGGETKDARSRRSDVPGDGVDDHEEEEDEDADGYIVFGVRP